MQTSAASMLQLPWLPPVGKINWATIEGTHNESGSESLLTSTQQSAPTTHAPLQNRKE